MKNIFLIILFAAVIIGCAKKEQNTEVQPEEKTVVEYDSAKAAKLGADEYGMKKYVFAFLKRGENKSANQEEAMELQKAHLSNIRRLAEEGKLVLAGPFMDNSDIRGIYIFNVESVEEAEELTKTDPAIKAGVLAMELKPWYGSAALMEVNKIGMTLAKKLP